MASPVAGSPNATRHRLLGSTRLISLIALAALLVLCFISIWLTRGAMVQLAFLRSPKGTAGQSLVDTRPWQTAQTLASLAVSAEEQEYAREAEHLADHEVDQAFAAALRSAELETSSRVLTGPALALSQRVTQLRQEIAQDKSSVEQIKAASAPGAKTGGNAAAPASGSDALQVAQAQLGLDSDELADTQHDLDRVTGNLSVRIQDELEAHEASMTKYDQQQQNPQPTAVVSVKSYATLAGRIGAWFSQRGRYASIQQALTESQNDATSLTAEHNALEAKVKSITADEAGHPLTLAEIKARSTRQQILSISDDRIQTDQQLASVYSKWGAQVLLQHTIVLHLILQSLAWIIAIVFCMILGDALVRRLMTHPSLDRRQAETLRTIFGVSVQVLGILVIVFIVFGTPRQTATMIGLATAAITITLQDYLLAFLGWFFLVGRNGIRVGDLVEVNSVCGEVIEVGLMSTTLLETTSLTDRGEPTGRRVSFLNSFAIRGQYFNFSSEGQWMWDDITVSIPAGEDIYAIATAVKGAVREMTAENARLAEAEWKRSVRIPGRTHLSGAAVVSLHPSGPVTDRTPSVDLRVRYVTRASTRFETRAQISREVIRMLQGKAWLASPEPALTASASS